MKSCVVKGGLTFAKVENPDSEKTSRFVFSPNHLDLLILQQVVELISIISWLSSWIEEKQGRTIACRPLNLPPLEICGKLFVVAQHTVH